MEGIRAADQQAADEMIDSAWHKQTTKRCEELAGIMRAAHDVECNKSSNWNWF